MFRDNRHRRKHSINGKLIAEALMTVILSMMLVVILIVSGKVDEKLAQQHRVSASLNTLAFSITPPENGYE